jgi:hypothetical protein
MTRNKLMMALMVGTSLAGSANAGYDNRSSLSNPFTEQDLESDYTWWVVPNDTKVCTRADRASDVKWAWNPFKYYSKLKNDLFDPKPQVIVATNESIITVDGDPARMIIVGPSVGSLPYKAMMIGTGQNLVMVYYETKNACEYSQMTSAQKNEPTINGIPRSTLSPNHNKRRGRQPAAAAIPDLIGPRP